MAVTRPNGDPFFMDDYDLNDSTSNAPFQPANEIHSTKSSKNNLSPKKSKSESPTKEAVNVRIWDGLERMELIKAYSTASGGTFLDERRRKELLTQSKNLEDIVNNNSSLDTVRGYNNAMYPYLVAIVEQGADLNQIKKAFLDDLAPGSFQRLAYPVLMKRLEKEFSHKEGVRYIIGCFKADELQKFRVFCEANPGINGLQARLDKKSLSPRVKT